MSNIPNSVSAHQLAALQQRKAQARAYPQDTDSIRPEVEAVLMHLTMMRALLEDGRDSQFTDIELMEILDGAKHLVYVAEKVQRF